MNLSEGDIKNIIWAWVARKGILLGQESVDDLAREITRQGGLQP